MSINARSNNRLVDLAGILLRTSPAYLSSTEKPSASTKWTVTKGLDEFLERERDRELFGLAPKQGEL